MAKVIKYGDVSGVETDFVHAPVGLYHAKAAEVSARNSSNTDEPMVEVRFELTKDADGKKLKKNYANVWYYAPLDPEASWARRLKELVVAYGLKASGGNLATIQNKEAMLRLKEDTDQDGEYRPRIAKILKAGSVEATEAEDEDVEEEDIEDEAEEDEDEGVDLDEMSRAELKAFIKEEELDVKVLKSDSDDDIRAKISEFLEEDEEEEAEEDEEEDEEPEAEAEEDEDEGDNYDSLTVADLRQECEDRELNSKGNKKALIARLRKDDESEPV
jgi:SAP domain-containing protein